MDTDLTGLPAQLQLNILTAIVVLKLLGQFYSSIRNGGGLRRIICAFWLGENLPQPVAKDYKDELSRPPFSPAQAGDLSLSNGPQSKGPQPQDPPPA